MKTLLHAVFMFFMVCVVLSAAGCAMFRIKVQDSDVSDLPAYDATYGAQDLRKLSEQVADEIAQSDFLSEQKDSPIMIIYGVQPRTTTFVDTQALTDRIRTILTQKARLRFVNESRRQELLKEQGYQAAHATQATQAAIGKQLGAKYMLTGSLVEITKETGRQARVSKTKLVYYQLTMEITDIDSGLIVWSTQKEFARQARKPLIGW